MGSTTDEDIPTLQGGAQGREKGVPQEAGRPHQDGNLLQLGFESYSDSRTFTSSNSRPVRRQSRI